MVLWQSRLRFCGSLLYAALAAAVLMAASPGLVQAGLIHSYDFNNSLADNQGGPDAVAEGAGFLNPSTYVFPLNDGLSIANVIDTNTYSIEMRFEFDDISGYRRILDFKNSTSDTGLYILDGHLNFYNEVIGPDSIISPTTFIDLLITRDGATDAFSAYVNGSATAQISFIDAAGLARFDQTDNLIRLFRDDNAVGGEASAGQIDYLRIYDHVIVPSAVPEPASMTLLAMGSIGLALAYCRRRQTRQRTA